MGLVDLIALKEQAVQKIRRLAFVLGLLLSFSGFGQEADLVSGLKLDPEEIVRLGAILSLPASPVNSPRQMREHFQAQDAAAFRLGDVQAREKVLREWYRVQPEIDSRWTLGTFLLNTEKVSEGFALLELLIKDLKIPNQVVRARARLALGYIEQNNLKRAEELLAGADAVIKKDFSRSLGGEAGYWLKRAEMEYNNVRGRLFSRMGRFDEALQAARLAIANGNELRQFESFVDQRQRTFSRSTYAGVATELAAIQTAVGRLLDADESLRAAYALFRLYDLNEDKMTGFFRRVADLRFSEGNYAETLKIGLMVRQAQKKQGYAENAAQSLWTRMRINSALAGQGKWIEAVAQFDEIDAIVGTDTRLASIARQTPIRALAYMNAGRVIEAQGLYQRSLDWHVNNFGANHYFTSLVRGLYAVSLSRGTSPGDAPKARAEFEIAIRDMTNPGTLAADYQENAFRRAVKDLIVKSYLKLLSMEALQTEKVAAEAFVAANHLIASSVQQAIAEAAARVGIKQPGLAAIVRNDQDTKNELASLYRYVTEQGSEGSERRNSAVVRAMRTRIAELEVLRRGFKDQIKKEFPDYFQLLQPKVPNPDEVAGQLAKGELFVSLLPLEEETYVFSVSPEGRVHFHRSPIGAVAVAKLVRQVRETLDVAGQGSAMPVFNFDAAYALYRHFFLPMESVLKGQTHLVIATSGVLGQLPFSVIPTKPWSSGRSLGAPWMIRDYAISHIPSANAWMSLKRLAQTPSGTQALLAWGDPLFAALRTEGRDGAAALGTSARSVIRSRPEQVLDIEKSRVDVLRYAEIPPLPDTRVEVIALARTLKANLERDVILGAAATRASVLAASQDGSLVQKRVIVFATHGLLPGDLPNLDQPALAMASSDVPGASPLLTLEDVLGLKLNAEWVVLSACNTAGADGRVEEAMSGLARGFFYAGSRSLLVTHWAVDSASATLLTTKTFEAYQAGVTRAMALRSAMMAVMLEKRYEHPAFWAPYALVGEGGG